MRCNHSLERVDGMDKCRHCSYAREANQMYMPPIQDTSEAQEREYRRLRGEGRQTYKRGRGGAIRAKERRIR